MVKLTDVIQWAEPGWLPIRYGFCPSEKAWDKWMKSIGRKGWVYPINDERSGCCSVVDTVDGNYCLVTINDKRLQGTYSPTCVLIHEAVHVKQYVVSQMGERQVGDEFEAYAVQNIAAFLIEAYTLTRGKKP